MYLRGWVDWNDIRGDDFVVTLSNPIMTLTGSYSEG